MKKLLVLLITIALASVSSGAIGATNSGGPTPGGFASDNVEHITHIPLNLDSAGARLLGDYFYITTSNGLMIYDVSEPETPEQLGYLPLPQTPYLAEEDVDTNGRLLLISSFTGLNVIDVEDKSNPAVVGELADADQHTYSCLLDCTWAYGSEGAIVDLRDPTAPQLAGDWTEGLNVQSTHDVTEVKKGFVLTSTQPTYLLDVRSPSKPKVLASGTSNSALMHNNLWPNKMKDKFFLFGTESGGPSCGEGSGSFQTWSAKDWQKTKSFKMIDEWRPENGIPTDGHPPANLYCGHWFDTRPGYRNGGLVAQGFYEAGTRFLEVSSKGKISEIGWFLPYAGSTSAAYWMNHEIVYAVDYNRGIDILRFTG
jgi:hypothetical protein